MRVRGMRAEGEPSLLMMIRRGGIVSGTVLGYRGRGDSRDDLGGNDGIADEDPHHPCDETNVYC